MILVLDIGNSRIKCGSFSDDKLISSANFTSIEQAASFIMANDFAHCCITSVSSSLTQQLTETVKKKIGIDPIIISSNSITKVKINYSTPHTLGIDRICSVEGALFINDHKDNPKKSEYIVTMDFGTATTINILQLPAIFLGGTISPGIKLMFDSLHSNTAQLPLLTVDDYESMIGKSTSASIASGVINSTIGLLGRIINHLKSDYRADEVYLFLTGGNAKGILPFISYPHIYEKALVLYGAYSLYKLNVPAIKN